MTLFTQFISVLYYLCFVQCQEAWVLFVWTVDFLSVFWCCKAESLRYLSVKKIL